MAGILDKKERVLDMIVTQEGKRQAATGQLRIRFASFTDMHTFYRASGSSDVAEPADNRIFFEATNRYQDTVVSELEPGNSLRPFRAGDFDINGKNVASGSFKVGFVTRGTVLTGSEIVDAKDSVLQGILNNFTDLRFLGTSDPFDDTNDFISDVTQKEFSMTPDTVFDRAPPGFTSVGNWYDEANIDTVPSLFQDRRFAHFSNFDYLPPVNLPSPESRTGVPLGNYLQLQEKADMTLTSIMESVKGRECAAINFTDTSRDNNLVGQFFEFSSDGIEKLSIVDAGEFEDPDPISPGKRVFYVGKMLNDDEGTQVFFNIFTVIFD
jgi:hypothetical protein